MWIIIVIGIALACTKATSVAESNTTTNEVISDKTLIELGRKLDKPMLTLLGIAIRNLHPCDQWSPWSKCEAKMRGQIGTRTRTRHCVPGRATDHDASSNETDIGLCEGICPTMQDMTNHGFCIKFQTTALAHDDAEKYCENEGGFLINIDSENKYHDVKSLLQVSGYSSSINIGGRRKSPNSPWVFKYGSQTSFFKWAPGDPDNTSSDLCMIYDAGTHVWYDTSCSTKRRFLCEIP